MFPGFMQAATLTFIVILVQTTKYIHCNDASSDIDESYILPLTKDTFDDAVKNNKHVFVKFFTPYCRYCVAIASDYAAVAKKLAESGSEIKLASVDGTVEKDLPKKFVIESYPTLILFSGDEQFVYDGDRSQNDIIKWLKKKTGPVAAELTTVDQLNTLKESDEVVVIGAFKDTDGDAAIAFLEIAKTNEDVSFGITSNKDLFAELNVTKDTIVLLKKFDEGRNDLTSSLDKNSIRKFIDINQFPIVTEYNLTTADNIISNDMDVYVLLFESPKDDNYEKIREEFHTTAKKFREKTRFITVDPNDSESEHLVKYFDLKESDFPAVHLITSANETNKFKLDSSDITSSVLTDFVNAYFDGKLKIFLSTEDIPEDWNKNPVTILVGKNFDEVARDKTKTVLVAFISPGCTHCKNLMPTYEELGEKYKDNSNIIIAKIDSTLNDVEGIKIPAFPTIKLFPKDTDEVFDYFGLRTVEDFSKFIDSNGKEDGKIGASATAAAKELLEQVKKAAEQPQETNERPEDTNHDSEEMEERSEDTHHYFDEIEEQPKDTDVDDEEESAHQDL